MDIVLNQAPVYYLLPAFTETSDVLDPARGHRPSQGGEQLASKLGKAETAFKWPQETMSFSALGKSGLVWTKKTSGQKTPGCSWMLREARCPLLF